MIVKSGSYEHSVWDSSSSQSEGVFVRVEGGNVYCVSVSYEGMNKQPESRVVENSSDILLDHDIMMTAQEINAQVPFTVTVTEPDGTPVMSKDFLFDAEKEKMYLIISSDDIICSS